MIATLTRPQQGCVVSIHIDPKVDKQPTASQQFNKENITRHWVLETIAKAMREVEVEIETIFYGDGFYFEWHFRRLEKAHLLAAALATILKRHPWESRVALATGETQLLAIEQERRRGKSTLWYCSGFGDPVFRARSLRRYASTGEFLIAISHAEPALQSSEEYSVEELGPHHDAVKELDNKVVCFRVQLK